MRDILVIGGPESGLQGVDQVKDDVVSILGAPGLYDRKWVVVWPAKTFLELPSDASVLDRILDTPAYMNPVVRSKYARLPINSGKAVAPSELEDFRKSWVLMMAISRLSKLQLAIAGGLNLVAVMGPDSSVDADSWTLLFSHICSAAGGEVRKYDSGSSSYGVLNSVKTWSAEFKEVAEGELLLRDLVPANTVISVKGHELPFDEDWFREERAAFGVKADISLPVTNRFGVGRAVEVTAGRGRILVIPPPKELRNFTLGMKTGGGASKTESTRTRKKSTAKLQDEYMTRKEAAEYLKVGTRTIDRWRNEGDLSWVKVKGEVRILKASVEALLKNE